VIVAVVRPVAPEIARMLQEAARIDAELKEIV